MRHFPHEEIRQYKEGVGTPEARREIAAHLVGCERCQEEFLTLVSTEEVERAAALLSPEFTDKVMGVITKADSLKVKGNVSIQAESRRYLRAKRQSLLIYYVGAAVITLIFVSGGMFQKIIDVTPAMMLSSAPEIREKVNIPVTVGRKNGFDLPQKAVDQAAMWIENFEMIKVGRGR